MKNNKEIFFLNKKKQKISSEFDDNQFTVHKITI